MYVCVSILHCWNGLFFLKNFRYKNLKDSKEFVLRFLDRLNLTKQSGLNNSARGPALLHSTVKACP